MMKYAKNRVLWNATAGMRLNDCRGKILVFNRYNGNPGGENSVAPSVRDSWKSSTGDWGVVKFPDGSEDKLYLQNDYSIHANDASRKGVKKAANADPHGSFTARLVALKNYFLVKSHRISLSEGDESSVADYTITVDKSSGGEPANHEDKNLFDNDYRTEWHSTNRVDGKWFVEFHTNVPISPKSYAFITGNDSYYYWDRTPHTWRVLGKKNASDDWTVLSDLDIDRDKGEAWVAGLDRVRTPDFKFNVTAPKDMQYFRFEIIQSFGSNAV